MTAWKPKLEKLITPTLKKHGCSLWALQIITTNNTKRVQVMIDKPKGVNIETCAAINRQIQSLFNVEKVITGIYTLEISSPGLNRPLISLAHFKQYLGRHVQFTLRQTENHTKKLLGRLLAANEQSFEIQTTTGPQTFPWTMMIRANLETDFSLRG